MGRPKNADRNPAETTYQDFTFRLTRTIEKYLNTIDKGERGKFVREAIMEKLGRVKKP